MSQETVRYELREVVAMLWLDDGKANALTQELIGAVHTGLDRAEKEAQAALLIGRPGRFSGGFDLKVMRQGGPAVGELVNAGAELALRLYGFPVPVVLACTGHAIAMGAILCMAADARLGAQGDFKIGLNEVAIGMTLPDFGIEFARARLTPRELMRATVGAEIYTPQGAVEAGFLDRLVSPERLVDEALVEAQRWAQLDRSAHHNTKLRLRGPTIARIEATLAENAKQLAADNA
ncbi:MAG: crotonase/enoyl-CoA hydratase family protein [Myxococcota bacterium]